MEKLKKTISVLLIVLMIFYVNYSFASDVTNENFYDVMNKLHEGFTVRSWNGDTYEEGSSKSRISIDFTEYKVRKDRNKIIYTIPAIDNLDEKDIYELEYSINSEKFISTIRLNVEALKYLTEKSEADEIEINMIAIAMSQAFIAPMCVIALANITDVIPEDAYQYYYSIAQNEKDERNIFKISKNETDEINETKIEIDLNNFAKINNTYYDNNSKCEITYQNKDLSTAKKPEDDKKEENNTTNNENVKKENTNTNTNTNNNANINTNNNTNTKIDLNKNLNKSARNVNANTKNTNKNDNSTSKKILPKAGAYEVSLLIVSVCMIGLYSYKKYTDIF